jgi:tartrate-resistant acid phosphatase type 5
MLNGSKAMIRRSATPLFLFILAVSFPICCQDGWTQDTPAVDSAVLPKAVLDRLPSAYRQKAGELLKATDPLRSTEWVQEYLRTASDEELNGWMIQNLATKPAGAEFLADRVQQEPSAELRMQIILSLRQYWQTHPQAQPILEKAATADPSAKVSLEALETLRSIRTFDLDKLLQQRIVGAKAAGDREAIAQLAAEDERWFAIEHEIMLPAFLRKPPPLFSVEPASAPIRVLAFGDFGTGSEAQKQLAAAMVAYHKEHPFNFGLTLGDNFYTRGMESPADPRWLTQWEQLYGPMGIKFYATLGNHDWGSSDSPAAEILYSDKSPDWRLPAPYYTFTAGPVQFFAFDTVEVNEAELQWLDAELAKSTARWKVVFGHYHIFSATRLDNHALIEKLLPVLEKHDVDIYLNGHDHNLQELKPIGSLHFFVNGGGGAGLYDFNPYDKSVYKRKANGFTVLEADQNHIKISFVGIDGKELYHNTLSKKS